jgi:predicted nucleic acid-binding protein
MPAYFLDSSAVVKRYVLEAGSRWVRALMAPAAGNELFLALIAGVEVTSALVRHAPPLPPADLARALRLFQRHFRTRFRRAPVNRAAVGRAMVLAVRHRLRGYDAVQLAVAVGVRARLAAAGSAAPVFVSADALLNNAAVAEGFAVDDPNLHP